MGFWSNLFGGGTVQQKNNRAPIQSAGAELNALGKALSADFYRKNEGAYISVIKELGNLMGYSINTLTEADYRNIDHELQTILVFMYGPFPDYIRQPSLSEHIYSISKRHEYAQGLIDYFLKQAGLPTQKESLERLLK